MTSLILIMKIIGIGIAVIILIVTIFVIVKLVGSTKIYIRMIIQKLLSSYRRDGINSKQAKDTVTVPKVEGMTKDEAVKALNEVGLGYKQVVQSSKTVAKDTVISQGTKARCQGCKEYTDYTYYKWWRRCC